MTKETKKYETLFKESIKASFDAGISVKLTKEERGFVNLSIAFFDGKTFTINKTKGMSIVLRPKQTEKLIQSLQKALDAQIEEIADVSEPEGVLTDW
ncbi:MAG: hypothetical protein ACFE8J_08730 [Candidatus Heimdallarchaeota archaeon]